MSRKYELIFYDFRCPFHLIDYHKIAEGNDYDLRAMACKNIAKRFDINIPLNISEELKSISDEMYGLTGEYLSSGTIDWIFYDKLIRKNMDNLTRWTNDRYDINHELTKETQYNIELPESLIGYLISPIKDICYPINSKWVECMNIINFALDDYYKKEEV